MKTMNVMKGMAFAAMMVMSVNAMAQRQGHDRMDTRHDGYRIEMRHDDHRMDARHREDIRHREEVRYGHGPVVVHESRGHAYNPYEGRVRHMPDGRWGYLRDNRWYYYDTYFEPEYYFSHPVRHFRSHRVGKTVAAVAAGMVVGSIITALIAR